MNNQYTDISIVQDKSGSMGHFRAETIDGFNCFLDQQKAVPGKCTLTLTQFDTSFNRVHRGKPIADVPHLDESSYVPGGYTALLDAIGITIEETGERLAALPEAERPARVLFVITTDGYENSSREYTRAQIFAMIKEQTEHWKWTFLFLGANQDAIQEGGNIGIISANAMSTGATGQAVREAYSAFSMNVADYRLCSNPDDKQDLAFKKAQRKAQVKEGAKSDALNK